MSAEGLANSGLGRPARRLATGRSAPPSDKWLSTWVEKILILQMACQLAVLMPFLAPLRVIFRTAAFGSSLLLLVYLWGGKPRHPAAKPAMWVLGIVGLSFFHPTTNSILAGAAQVTMYTAILAPLLWVPRCGITPTSLRRVILLLWVFHSFSAVIGVLQVYFPGQFQPTVSTWITSDPEKLKSLQITLASGQQVLRPMGLTDLPGGGAAFAGFYSVLLGLCLLASERRPKIRALSAGSLAVGFFCLYLSQVRSLLILSAICLLAFAALLAYRGALGKLAGTTLIVAAIVVGSFGWAVSLGGESVTGRLETLVSDDPREVYRRNRGVFLEYTVDVLLPKYPLGAGLGRWGMMYAYFGDRSDPERKVIFAEIQWTGWLLDGGLPLIFAYLAAIAMAFWVAWILATRRGLASTMLWLYAAVVFAYNMGVLALSFNHPVFMSQMALELWILNASLYAAYQHERRVRRQAQLKARRSGPPPPPTPATLPPPPLSGPSQP